MEIVHQAEPLGGLFNILSILLGLFALGFAVQNFEKKGTLTCTGVSFGCCAVSLLCQLMELSRLAGLRDWAAVEDTVGARVLAGCILVGGTLVLDVLALLRGRRS